MKVEIDQKSGFCFGVVNAIQKVEEALKSNDKLYCLGDIVHNNMEVERLAALGLITINHDQFQQLSNCKVLIRAHGEPPSTYEHARKNNIELIDATCPVVLKLQQRIAKSYSEEKQLIIYGRKGHAEVIGLNGQVKNKAIIVEDLNDLKKVDYSKPITVFAQTTKSISGLQEIKKELESKASAELKVNDTICRQVANRVPHIRKFAAKYDCILFVGGKKSSNGKLLYKECQQVNTQSYFISNIDEIDDSWFENANSVGICGATSTPQWLMEKVARYVEPK
ncbi:4-hydroxy-3-methylbut-2-enyl diphosphate reductase [Prolixibacteraceae bacterium JC049]|nr:4-hydroxy-3-methylbut-2-enyl diphosphate reductase [Prolixibacteraceae bacterium JC049]